MHKDKQTMLNYLHCLPVVYEGMERTLGDNNGEETVSAAQARAENMQYAAASVGQKRAARAGKANQQPYKKVKCIKKVSASTDLHTYRRPCAYGTCALCGPAQKLPLTCPVDMRDDILITVRDFQMVKRGSREQKELVEVQMTPRQIMTELRGMCTEYTSHQWDKKWDLHCRRLLLETFSNTALVIQTDFSATTDLNPQDRINSAIAGHAIQDVILVSHSPTYELLPNGYPKRIIENEVFHCWGEETKDKLTNDNFYSTACIRRVLRILRERDLQFTHVYTVSAIKN